MTDDYYLGARYYNPRYGRFLSVEPLIQDPLSTVGGSPGNVAYTYGKNNPVSFFDPNGFREMGFLDRAKAAWDVFYDVVIDYSEEEQLADKWETIDRAIEFSNYDEYGGMAGPITTRRQMGEIGSGVYASGKGAIPVAKIVAQLATLPFGGGGTSVGAKISGRIAGRYGLRKGLEGATASAINAFGKGVAKNSIEVLAGEKTIDQAADAIARDVVSSFITGGIDEKLMKDKLMPFIKKSFENVLGKFGNVANEAGVTEKIVGAIKDEAVKLAEKMYTLDFLNEK
jgi:RHS repeat-associated protein